MFIIREAGREKYLCVVEEGLASISVELTDEEYPPTKFNTIDEAKKEIESLVKNITWQIVVC